MLRSDIWPDDKVEILRQMCLEDGMWSLRAKWIFEAVQDFGSAHAAVQPDKIYCAP